MIEQVPYNALDVKGRIKVELFEDDKKVNEVMSNNFISKGVKDYYYKLAMKSLYTQKRLKGGHDYRDDMLDIFQTICLTDASHPSDPENEWYMKGKLIGYALNDTAYSGTELLQGSYNAVESSTTTDSVKMVFDFPTHAANGTIKSVYFRNMNNSFPFINYNYMFKKVMSYAVAVNMYNDKIYILGNEGTSIHYDSTRFTVWDKNFKLLETYILPSYCNDFEIHNDYIYFSKNHSSDSIWKTSINTPDKVSTIVGKMPNNLYARGIVYDESRNIFLVSCSDTAGSNTNIVQIIEYDLSFNVLNTIKIDPIYGTYHGKLKSYEGAIFISRIYSHNTGLLNADYTVGRFVAPNFLFMMDNMMVNVDGYLTPKIEIASRCLLDAPITKTSKQTMKITYEFVLE